MNLSKEKTPNTHESVHSIWLFSEMRMKQENKGEIRIVNENFETSFLINKALSKGI